MQVRPAGRAKFNGKFWTNVFLQTEEVEITKKHFW